MKQNSIKFHCDLIVPNNIHVRIFLFAILFYLVRLGLKLNLIDRDTTYTIHGYIKFPIQFSLCKCVRVVLSQSLVIFHILFQMHCLALAYHRSVLFSLSFYSHAQIECFTNAFFFSIWLN